MTTSKKIFLADSTLEFLKIIGDRHGDDIELGLSSSVNLAVQFCALIASENKLRLSARELLFCCDVLNGGAQMTEFQTPDSVSIANALESMKFGLQAATSLETATCEKWDADPRAIITKTELMDEAELFTLAIATRQFWSGHTFSGIKPPGDCESYDEWATQWVDPDRYYLAR